MWSDIVGIYRSSKKKKDINWFTEWIARPPAAVVVYFLRNTRITPNQITFLSAVVAAAACAMFALWPSASTAPWTAAHLTEWSTDRTLLVVAALVFELSFVLDCADGQLARLRKIASPIGHLLDFLMDELKAMLLLACVTIRLWQESGDDRLMIVGLLALFCLAAGLSLTSFTRRPEYGAKPPTEDGQPAEVGGRRGFVGLAVSAIEFPARIVVHYPQYLWLCALLDRMDVYFWAYSAVNALYFLKVLAAILFRLGRFAPRSSSTS
ncbi:MAG: CDP-alcohol phosphatidyltransferase family protein [Kofleriaceae bacterium]